MFDDRLLRYLRSIVLVLCGVIVASALASLYLSVQTNMVLAQYRSEMRTLSSQQRAQGEQIKRLEQEQLWMKTALRAK